MGRKKYNKELKAPIALDAFDNVMTEATQINKDLAPCTISQSDLLKVQNFFETMPKLSKTHHFECKKCNYTEDIVIEGLQSFFV